MLSHVFTILIKGSSFHSKCQKVTRINVWNHNMMMIKKNFLYWAKPYFWATCMEKHGKTRFLKTTYIIQEYVGPCCSWYMIFSDEFQHMFQHVSTIDDYPQWLSHITQELRQRCLPLALNAHDVPDEVGLAAGGSTIQFEPAQLPRSTDHNGSIWST